MNIENLRVRRLVLHEVFRRTDDHKLVPPRYGAQLVQLPPDAMEAFRTRITDTLGSASQSMGMVVRETGPGSAFDIASELVDAADPEFIDKSSGLADLLARAQLSRNVPGGILAVFDGTAGAPARRILGIIKAETHSGFRRHVSAGVIQVEFFRDLFLTPQTKLYKIGMLCECTGEWEATVYDSHLSASNRDGAAKYFYDNFLGCAIPENSARLTKQFFEKTRDFIKQSDLPGEEKADLVTSLYTYLKVDQTPTVEVSAFANSYLAPDLRDEYRGFMGRQRFPMNAIAKDIGEIQNALRLRKITFSNSIRLTAPPEAFGAMVTVETVPAAVDGLAGGAEWTQITIRDRIRDEG